MTEKEEEKSKTLERHAVYSFKVPEYIKYNRGVLWYCVSGILVIGGIVYAMSTTNYLFGFIILLLGFIIIARDFRQPAIDVLHITDEGVYRNDRFTAFHEFGLFWIVYDPPMTKQLYLKKRVGNEIEIIPLNDVDPVEIRQWMRNKVRENLDEKDAPMLEIWSRLLKL